MEVPPLAANSQAGWYPLLPIPGQLGPAVLLGHVDSAEYGPGIFFRLGALKPGDTVTVTRADHVAATFRGGSRRGLSQGSLPDPRGLRQHRRRGTPADHLRRILRPRRRSYRNNIVVYASLVGSAGCLTRHSVLPTTSERTTMTHLPRRWSRLAFPALLTAPCSWPAAARPPARSRPEPL